MIFGGDVTHSGLPVTSGTRHLFVMSFTLKQRQARAASDQPLPVTASMPTEESVEVHADLDALDEFADLFM